MTNRFRAARKAIPMTQAHLAQAAGVTERTIRSLEKGEPVSPETIHAVSAVLGMAFSKDVPMEDRYGEEFQPTVSKFADKMMYVIPRLLALEAVAFICLAILSPVLLLSLIPPIGMVLYFLYCRSFPTGHDALMSRRQALAGHFYILVFRVPAIAPVAMALENARFYGYAHALAIEFAFYIPLFVAVLAVISAIYLMAFDKSNSSGRTLIADTIEELKSVRTDELRASIHNASSLVFGASCIAAKGPHKGSEA